VKHVQYVNTLSVLQMFKLRHFAQVAGWKDFIWFNCLRNKHDFERPIEYCLIWNHCLIISVSFHRLSSPWLITRDLSNTY